MKKSAHVLIIGCTLIALVTRPLFAEEATEILCGRTSSEAVVAPGEEARDSRAIELFAVSPALFVENQGQWSDPTVRYVHDGDSMAVAATDSGIRLQVCRQNPAQDAISIGLAGEKDRLSSRAGVDIQTLWFSVSFIGAKQTRPVGLEQSASLFNYCVGDQANWRQNVPSYEVVAHEGLYEGVDLHIRGLRSHLKYEFHVSPGADYRQIAVRYEGIEGLSIDDDGALWVNLGEGWGSLRDDAPYIYREIDGKKQVVAGRFTLLDARTYAFDITDDVGTDHALVIDPNLAWSTYLGGSEIEYGKGIAVDGSGNVFVTGVTDSSGWVSGGFDTAYHGMRDMFVAKLSSSGAHLWSTYVGGSRGESVDIDGGIAVDASGNVYVAGYTDSAGWTSGGFDTTYNDGGDAFVAKLNSSGAHLWSTYLGGSDLDGPVGMGADASGSIYVYGLTRSADWTSGGYDTTFDGGWQDAFVVKLSSSGSHLWSTYLGGNANEGWLHMAVDASGVYVTGYTYSSGWTDGGFDTSYNGGDGDVFLAKLSVNGSHLWSTYLGGSEVDLPCDVATDVSGNVYVSGDTTSAGWTSGGFDTTFDGSDRDEVFLVKLSSSGLHLWSTYLGGSANDACYGTVVDASGSIYLTGITHSSGWTSGGFDTTYNGDADVFVARLSSSGSHLWSTYLGGSESDYSAGIALDGWGNVYVTGTTVSPGWTSGGFDTTYGGLLDGFVAKLDSSGAHLWSTYVGGSGGDGIDRDDGIVVDASGNVFVLGDTDSTDWASGGFDTTYDGGGDVFVAKIGELSGDDGLSPVYRFWSPQNSRHFYTISEAEKQYVQTTFASNIWTYETVAYYAFADDGEPGLAPVYRFWSNALGAHFYTISEIERDYVIDNLPAWTYEGPVFYAYPEGSQPVGASPVYRFWSDILSTHFYTIDEAEKDYVIDNLPSWEYETVAWYAYE